MRFKNNIFNVIRFLHSLIYEVDQTHLNTSYIDNRRKQKIKFYQALI